MARKYTISRKYKINDNYFEVINTEDKAYWLGFLYADGTIVKQPNREKSYTIAITLKETDKYILESFIEKLESDYYLWENTINGSNYYRLTIRCMKMAQDLMKHGVVPNKTHVLKFPNSETVPNFLMSHFVRGFFDGDGYVGIKKHKRGSYSASIEFVCASYNFTKELQNRIFNDTTHSFTLSRKTKTTHRLRKHSKKVCLDFFKYIYKDSNTTNRLNRKYKKFKIFIDYWEEVETDAETS